MRKYQLPSYAKYFCESQDVSFPPFAFVNEKKTPKLDHLYKRPRPQGIMGKLKIQLNKTKI